MVRQNSLLMTLAQEKIKSYIDSLIEELKNSNTKSDDRNYIISDGKKVEW